MREVVTLLLVCALCAACTMCSGYCPYCPLSECEKCRGFANALIYCTDTGTVSHINLVKRCERELRNPTYPGCDFHVICCSYYSTEFETMSAALEKAPKLTPVELCNHVCASRFEVQLTEESDAKEGGKRPFQVGRNNIFLQTLMSDMQREDTERKVQENCNLCKSVAQVVSASSVDLREDQDNVEASTAFNRCLEHPSDTDRPSWYRRCLCGTLVYDIVTSPLVGTGSYEAICESIGRCPRSGMNSLFTTQHRKG